MRSAHGNGRLQNGCHLQYCFAALSGHRACSQYLVAYVRFASARIRLIHFYSGSSRRRLAFYLHYRMSPILLCWFCANISFKDRLVVDVSGACGSPKLVRSRRRTVAEDDVYGVAVLCVQLTTNINLGLVLTSTLTLIAPCVKAYKRLVSVP